MVSDPQVDGELELWETLLAFQSRAPVIAKNEEADTGKYTYKYAGLNQVWAQIADLMDELKLVYLAVPELSEGRLVVRCILRHIPSGQSLEGIWPVRGDTPQAQGGGLTYARRYALVAMLNLRVSEDDDALAAEAERAAMTPSERMKASQSPSKAVAAPRKPRPRPATPPPVDGQKGLPANVRARFFATLAEIGLTDREPIMAYVNETLAKHNAQPVESSTELTPESAGWVIDRAKRAADADPGPEVPA
jgi:hypothetical protein